MLNDTTTWSHAPDNQVVPSRWQMTPWMGHRGMTSRISSSSSTCSLIPLTVDAASARCLWQRRSLA